MDPMLLLKNFDNDKLILTFSYCRQKVFCSSAAHLNSHFYAPRLIRKEILRGPDIYQYWYYGLPKQEGGMSGYCKTWLIRDQRRTKKSDDLIAVKSGKNSLCQSSI